MFALSLIPVISFIRNGKCLISAYAFFVALLLLQIVISLHSVGLHKVNILIKKNIKGNNGHHVTRVFDTTRKKKTLESLGRNLCLGLGL